MARSSKVEECMFCGNIPCTCNAPAAKKPKPRLVKPKETVAEKDAAIPSEVKVALPASAPKVNIRAAMKSQAQPLPSPLVTVAQAADDGVSPELASALRAFDKFDMIHPDDRKQYAEVLDAPPSTDERIVTWKNRRNYDQAD